MCGGTGSCTVWMPPVKGLSPRVRGNPFRRRDQHALRRSIPACAGEPGPAAALRAPSAVYPRVCGGTAVMPGCQTGIGGLSPRVRGNPLSVELRSSKLRSIPACAGEPGRIREQGHSPAVYPRVCGGTKPVRVSDLFPWGLSPRVRGNPHSVGEYVRGKRSIPACAGEPVTPSAAIRAVEVYPRVCGGTLLTAQYLGGRDGLSPRVRGNPWIIVRR